jgi:hypothetical protein
VPAPKAETRLRAIDVVVESGLKATSLCEAETRSGEAERAREVASRCSIVPRGGAGKAHFRYDSSASRYRDQATGRFVAARDLPWPSNAGFADRARGMMSKDMIVDRIGRRSGRFASEGGTSVSARGLPPGSEALPFERFKVLKPFEADIGTAGPVPEFGATGGAKQFYFFDKTVQELVDEGFLGVTK